MKRIAILGSTGSIGTSSLMVARHLKEMVKVTALAARANIELLEQQVREFHPEIVGVYDENQAKLLAERLPYVHVVGGMEGLKEVAAYDHVDLVISAIAGSRGLVPTVAAIEAGKDVALACKEVLVSAGALVMSLVRNKGVSLLPIDSEHSAIFQCLNGEKSSSIKKIILTASGGPFRCYSLQELENITVDDALAHPTWKMGPKVTIDCSTLMNKGLEVIEAYWLFGVKQEQLEVVVHPQSIVHSMVEFIDGSLLAQMGKTTMLTPIQYAMTYPERMMGSLESFDFSKYNTLQFFPPDVNKFLCLGLAFEAIKQGGSMPCYMNAVNEVLVGRFLQRELAWREIATKLERLMMRHRKVPAAALDEILEVDAEARREASII